MRRTSLLVLGLITLAAVGGAVFVLIDRETETASTVGAGNPFFPGLLDTVNTVQTVVVRSREETATIVRGDGAGASWQVAERSFYPADAGKVRELVVGAATLTLVESRTANPELFGRLHLRSVEDSESEAVSVTLRDADGKELAAFLRGKTDSFGTGGQRDRFFVRRPGQDQTWLAEGNVDVAAGPSTWLDRSMPQVTEERVRSVVIRHADGETVEIDRDSTEQRDFSYRALPEGMEPKRFAINNTASALDFISFEDVRPVDEVAFEQPVTARYRTFDGLTVDVTVTRADDEAWLRFAAEGEAVEPAPAPAAADAEAGESGATAEATEPARDVVAEAAEINDRYGAWAFRVSSYMADRLTRRGAALFEAPEPAEGKETAP